MTTTSKSISAYSLADRVRSYDADMDLMHPNRGPMVAAALRMLPFPVDAPLRALDLGVGTGFFAARFLEAFPQAQVVAVDGAEAMVGLAQARLGGRADAVRFVIGDFRRLPALLRDEAPFDVVLSAYALHHLTRADKTAVVREACRRLRPGGWFLNADLIRSASPELEARIQALRVAGIVSRNAGADPRFADAAATRRHLDELEAADGDQPLTLQEDLAVLADAGLRQAGVFWLEHREAVTGGLP